MTEWEQIKMETQLNNMRTFAEMLRESALCHVQLEAQRLQKMAVNLAKVMPANVKGKDKSKDNGNGKSKNKAKETNTVKGN